MAARRLFMTHMESQKADRVTVAAAAHDGHMTEDNFERFLRFRLNAMCKILNKTLGKRVRRKHFLARGLPPGLPGGRWVPPAREEMLRRTLFPNVLFHLLHIAFNQKRKNRSKLSSVMCPSYAAAVSATRSSFWDLLLNLDFVQLMRPIRPFRRPRR
mgnify:CR=1 FL=1